MEEKRMKTSGRLDETEVYRWYDIMKSNHDLVEIRIIGDRQVGSGYFTNAQDIVEAIKPYSDKCGIYFTMNSINPACYSREQKNRIVFHPKNTTTDAEILTRDYVLIDLDPVRPSGVCSTKEEAIKAHEKGNDVYQFLLDNGFYEPIMLFSSSGIHLYLRCCMTNTPENTNIVKRFLQAIDMLFSDEYVSCDCSVYNAARIARLPGSFSSKGASNDASRPQRKCRFLNIPQEIKINTIEYFQKVANMYPTNDMPSRDNNYSTEKFNLDDFIKRHNIAITKVEKIAGGKKYILEHCPFNADHKGKDAVLFQKDTGEIAFHCFHASDSDKGWREFRTFFEPDAYTKNTEHYSNRFGRYRGRYMDEAPVFVPQEESDDKGKKWLGMNDIKRVNIEELLSIPTGYKELDKKIGGLFAGELTVLSGANACVDCDTEYFNGKGWKKISEYTEGDKVLQYNEDGSAELVTPLRYIKEPCDNLHLMKSTHGVNQCLCDEHNVVYMSDDGKPAKIRMKDLMEQHESTEKGFPGKLYTTFKYSGKGIDLSDAEIRVMCAVICDGSFIHAYADKSLTVIRLKKQRKIDRLEKLLHDAHIEYRKEQYCPKDRSIYNYIFKAPRVEKEFGDYWYGCNAHQLAIVAEEVFNFDGCIAGGAFYQTRRSTIDFIQFALASCGKRSSIIPDNRVGKQVGKGKYRYKSVCYALRVYKENMVSLYYRKKKTQITDYKTKDGYKYCFTVPSGMLVLRREGRINITGNCGKTSWLDCVALNAVQSGYKVGIWSGEMQDWRFQNWINQIAAGKSYTKKNKEYDNLYYVPTLVSDKINEWLTDKLFLYNNNYGNNFQQIMSDIMSLVDTKGIQLVIIDNLAALNIDSYDGEMFSKQRKFILEIKDYAKRKNIHIILVCHPRKQTTFLRKESISGTADLTNIADNVFIIHRVGRDFEERATEFLGATEVQKYMTYSNLIEVCKNRNFGVVDYIAGMYFEPESKRLKNDIAEHIQYGWEDIAEQEDISYDTSYQPNNDMAASNEFDEQGYEYLEDLPY